MSEQKTTQDRCEELVAYYEAAGFGDFRERELDGKSDRDIARLYATHRLLVAAGSAPGRPDCLEREDGQGEQTGLRLLEYCAAHAPTGSSEG